MTCRSCGNPSPEGARFCAYCGTPLAPGHLADGERKYATVLFADVVGSTALSERLDPEDVAEIMNGAFAFMNAAVIAYGGTVGRLMGDAILAFFGAPHALEDHAARAVHAGLAIQEASAEYADTLARAYGIDFRMRVGIATGLVVFTTVGDGSKTEYTAMGDTANVAARLQGLAAPGTVLIDGETEGLARKAFRVERADPGPLKGKREAVEVYRVLGPRGAEDDAGPDALVNAPLVGRDPQLARIAARIRGLGDGRGGFVLLIGDAGVGKSRLLTEARERHLPKDGDVVWVEGRAVSYGQTYTYHPWQAALRKLLGLHDPSATAGAPSPGVDRAGLAAGLDRLAIADEHRPYLARVLGIDAGGPATTVDAAVTSAEEAAGRIGASVRALLAAAAGAAPIVLVLEDLHWADAASIDLLGAVADLVQEAPLLVVAAMRPERAAPAWRLKARIPATLGDAFEEVDLEPLDAAEAAAMLAEVPAAAALPAALRERIVKMSDGNPFFLEEILRDLIDAGHLVREGARWRVAGSVDRIDIPDTLLGVLTARIDRLPESTKQVAQTAAVIGRTFATPVLRGVVDSERPQGAQDLTPHLDTLSREELVRALEGEAAQSYRFKHALSQEAAYAGLLLRRRRDLHRRVLDVLERTLGDGRHAHAAELAYHALRAESWHLASVYSALAGDQAVQVYAVTEALQHYTNAVESGERLDEPDPRWTIQTILAWVDVSVRSLRHESPGPRQAILERLDRAERLARELEDRTLLARVLVNKGNVLALSGFPGTAYPLLEEASRLATDLDDEPLFLLPFYYATERMVDLDPRAAAVQLDEFMVMAQRFGNRAFEAHARAVKAMALARIGESDAARAEIEAALAMGPNVGSRIKEADVNIVAGMVFLELGEHDRAVALSELGAQQALEIGGMECACSGYYVNGMSRLTIEQLQEASAAFQRSIHLGSTPEMRPFVNLATAGDAVARLGRGDAAAVGELEAALANARSFNDPYGVAMLARLLGTYHLEQGDAKRAADLLVEAAAYYRSTGMKPDLARTLGPAADALERAGRADEARAIRQDADAISAGRS